MACDFFCFVFLTAHTALLLWRNETNETFILVQPLPPSLHIKVSSVNEKVISWECGFIYSTYSWNSNKGYCNTLLLTEISAWRMHPPNSLHCSLSEGTDLCSLICNTHTSYSPHLIKALRHLWPMWFSTGCGFPSLCRGGGGSQGGQRTCVHVREWVCVCVCVNVTETVKMSVCVHVFICLGNQWSLCLLFLWAELMCDVNAFTVNQHPSSVCVCVWVCALSTWSWLTCWSRSPAGSLWFDSQRLHFIIVNPNIDFVPLCGCFWSRGGGGGGRARGEGWLLILPI